MAFRVDVWSTPRAPIKGTSELALSDHFSNNILLKMAASKSRTVILTGGVAAITAMGAWYGATLKTDREVRQVCI